MKNPEFGRRLKKLREDITIREGKKITQAMVGKAIGLADRYYQRLEAGHVPKGETVGKLGKYFQCSVDWLLYGKGSKPSDASKSKITYQSPDQLDVHVCSHSVDYGASEVDSFTRAVGQLKTIFDSRDLMVIQTIVATLNTFAGTIEKNQKLSYQINILEERIEELELKIGKGSMPQSNIGDIATDTPIDLATEKKVD